MKTLNFELKTDSTVNGTGNWTMIYDEGFEITYQNTKLLLFSKFYIKPGTRRTYISNCALTLVGWFHNFSSGEVGCIRGQKMGVVDRESMLNEYTSPDPSKGLQPKKGKKPGDAILREYERLKRDGGRSRSGAADPDAGPRSIKRPSQAFKIQRIFPLSLSH